MTIKILRPVLLATLVIFSGAASCTVFKWNKDEGGAPDKASEVMVLSGFDVEGRERTCPEVTCSDATSVASPPESFTAKCAAENSVVKTCACGDYICVDPKTLPLPPSAVNKMEPGKGTFTGYDIKGKHVSCTPSGAEIACTAIYGPDEEFAQRCTDGGYQAFTCGCHDYLCSEKID